MRPAILNPLFADVTALKGVGPKVAALIGRAAGSRVVDLLMTPPISVIDRSARPKIAEAENGKLATIEVLVDKHEPSPKGRRLPYKVICFDETGFVTLVFFHARQDYLQKTLPEGKKRLVSGQIEDFKGGRQIVHPDYIVDPDKPGDMPFHEPVYPLTAGLSAAVMRKATAQAVARAPELAEWQNASWLKQNDWPAWREAVKTIHAPMTASDLSLTTPVRMRAAYDELLANQLALLLIRRARVKSKGRALSGDVDRKKRAYKSLPFKLTGAQTRSLKEITEDMRQSERMVRLVQGDVGSGKTIVAFFAALQAIESGTQAALMAPTEILARQHMESLKDLADAAEIRMEILSGRDKGAARREKLSALADGEIDLLVGTHAIFQDDVGYRNLGLVIIDEQHRFGVHQRVTLTQKGAKPDLLVMTATPIPRTLALTAYGDMDVSKID
ncbi:MAG: DEAD/DEAH box helicase, partial [Marinicaulis sp.]|nr:DEAD/DEAH box helicase [Marinicaulis sp.]